MRAKGPWAKPKRWPLSSCNALFFRKGREYEQRHRRNLRNRAYNIHQKNKFTRQTRRVMWYLDKVDRGLIVPTSQKDVYDVIGPNIMFACLFIDFCAVQGVIKHGKACVLKDTMMRRLRDIFIKMKFIKRPKDRYEPAFKTIGYQFPVYELQREPRPWQLPGWKSPEMLRREYLKWVEKRNEKIEKLRAKQAEEAEA